MDWQWRFIHRGYYIAESPATGNEYVIRTRPLNDGWMAICSESGLVIGTGLSIPAAKQRCIDADKHPLIF